MSPLRPYPDPKLGGRGKAVIISSVAFLEARKATLEFFNDDGHKSHEREPRLHIQGRYIFTIVLIVLIYIPIPFMTYIFLLAQLMAIGWH
jgi:hypothetical protein